MKKIFAVVLMFLALAGTAFAAYTVYPGEGSQTIAPSSAVVGADITALTWTYTFATHSPTNDYVVKFKFPSALWATGTPVLTGTADGHSVISAYWKESGYTYLKVTGTAATTTQTLILTIPKVKCPDLAGVNGFEVYEVTNSKAITDTAGIAANASITVKAAMDYVSSNPTPGVILSTYIDTYTQEYNLNSAFANGFIKFTLPNSTWASLSTTTDAPGYVSITAALDIGTPVISSDGLSMIVAIPTMAINQKITVTFPNRTATADMTPLKTTYGINQQFGAYAIQAMNTSTELPTRTPYATWTGTLTLTPTETPTSTLTQTYSVGKWSTFACQTFTSLNAIPTATGTVKIAKYQIWVATPTVVLTPSYSLSGTTLIMSAPAGSIKKMLSSGGVWSRIGSVGSSGFTQSFDATQYGSYSITGIIGFNDTDNDGVYRTNTTNAVTLYKTIIVDDFVSRVNDGTIVKEQFTGSANAASEACRITLYASAQQFVDADFFGLSAAAFSRVVDGSANTVNYFSIPSDMSLGCISSPYILPANTRERWLMNTSTPVLVNGMLYRIALPTR